MSFTKLIASINADFSKAMDSLNGAIPAFIKRLKEEFKDIDTERANAIWLEIAQTDLSPKKYPCAATLGPKSKRPGEVCGKQSINKYCHLHQNFGAPKKETKAKIAKIPCTAFIQNKKSPNFGEECGRRSQEKYNGYCYIHKNYVPKTDDGVDQPKVLCPALVENKNSKRFGEKCGRTAKENGYCHSHRFFEEKKAPKAAKCLGIVKNKGSPNYGKQCSHTGKEKFGGYCAAHQLQVEKRTSEIEDELCGANTEAGKSCKRTAYAKYGDMCYTHQKSPASDYSGCTTEEEDEFCKWLSRSSKHPGKSCKYAAEKGYKYCEDHYQYGVRSEEGLEYNKQLKHKCEAKDNGKFCLKKTKKFTRFCK
ncbi:hypothetical protein OAF54_03540, partial [bacterium]|nr:hypothetical protein [bacterium]